MSWTTSVIFGRLATFVAVKVLPLFKILQFPLVFLLLSAVYKFSQLDLQPIHSPISLLNFSHRFLLIGLEKDLHKLVEILNLFLILSHPVLPQSPEIFLDLIPQNNSVIFDQFYIPRYILVHSSIRPMASLKKGASSWYPPSMYLDSYYWFRCIIR